MNLRATAPHSTERQELFGRKDDASPGWKRRVFRKQPRLSCELRDALFRFLRRLPCLIA